MTQYDRCRSKFGRAACSYHGSGFASLTVSETASKNFERANTKYTRVLRTQLLGGGGLSDETMKRVKDTFNKDQLLFDASEDGYKHLQNELRQRGSEYSADYRTQLYERKEAAEQFRAIISEHEARLSKMRELAVNKASKEFDNLTAGEGKEAKEAYYAELVHGYYKGRVLVALDVVEKMDEGSEKTLKLAEIAAIQDTVRNTRQHLKAAA